MDVEYVAYAYSHGDTNENVRLVQKYLNDNWLKTGACFSPVTMFHEQHMHNLEESHENDTKWWAALCRKFLASSNQVTVIVGEFEEDGEPIDFDKVMLSTGVLAEIAVATMLNIPVDFVYYNATKKKWITIPTIEVVNGSRDYVSREFLED